MSHLASPHTGHTGHGSGQMHKRASPRDIMAINFLAPQHTDSASTQSRQVQRRQDPKPACNPKPQLEAFVYGVNVHASMSGPLGTLPVTPPSCAIPYYQQRHASQVLNQYSSHNTSPTSPCSDQVRFDDLDRAPRERRDPYSEEMKFFIMFARIVKEQDWRKIEDDFERIFRQRRPRDGLTAVYYRIRNKWGMQQVLKSGGPDKYKTDISTIDERARGLPQQFLREVGYSP